MPPLPPDECPPDEPPAPQATTTLSVRRLDGPQLRATEDTVAEEVPVALVYNGISHAVLLATPADLEDLALGFSLSEGILATPPELFDSETVATPHGLELRLHVAAGCFADLKARRRSLAGRTGCGLCGVESLAALARAPGPVTRGAPIPASAIAAALAALPAHQPLRAATGAVHAAAWIDRRGTLLALREDVGRHNALDKLLGHLARSATDPHAGWVLVSSRASYEMVQKVATVGIGSLVAVSAPTALAIRLADAAGVTLAGFARDRRLVIYTHPDGLLADA